MTGGDRRFERSFRIKPRTHVDIIMQGRFGFPKRGISSLDDSATVHFPMVCTPWFVPGVRRGSALGDGDNGSSISLKTLRNVWLFRRPGNEGAILEHRASILEISHSHQTKARRIPSEDLVVPVDLWALQITCIVCGLSKQQKIGAMSDFKGKVVRDHTTISRLFS